MYGDSHVIRVHWRFPYDCGLLHFLLACNSATSLKRVTAEHARWDLYGLQFDIRHPKIYVSLPASARTPRPHLAVPLL